MANTVITPSWVLKETGMEYVASAQFIANIRHYDNQYEYGGAKVGATVRYRLPQRFTVSNGQALEVQPIQDQTVPISLTHQLHIDMGWSTAQQTTDIEEVRRRYVRPAGQALAAAADAFAFAAVYPYVYNEVGTPGTTPSATLSYLQAGVKLADMGAPLGDRTAVLDPMAMATIANSTASLFNTGGKGDSNYRKGVFAGEQLGFGEWYVDPNRPVHTTGSFTASTPLVNGAGQTGSSLITDGWASGATTLNRGDIFTVAGVYGVNPVSKVSTGRLQQFVVTATISDTTGAITAAISPSIITSGAYQTVSASPANDAVITVWAANPAGGTLSATASPVSMLFHPEAFVFSSADLELPDGGAKSTRINSKEAKFAMRLVQQYDVRTDQNISRVDILVGAAAPRPEWAVRMQG
jgi:hypothetical protein